MVGLVIDMDIIVGEFFPAGVAMACKGRNDVHVPRPEVLHFVGEYDLCVSFGHVIYPGERAANVLIVPVFVALCFPDVEHDELHLVDVGIHDGTVDGAVVRRRLSGNPSPKLLNFGENPWMSGRKSGDVPSSFVDWGDSTNMYIDKMQLFVHIV